MKTTKQTLLSIAIIAALPFAAHATQTIVETNTPAAVGANGTVKKAADSGPYQTATIGEHDDEHIATTAYVKGAYNDAIAAVNKVDADKQVKLKNAANNNPILPKVMSGSGFNSLADGVLLNGVGQDEYAVMAEAIAYDLTGVHNNAAALNDTLISAETVMQWLRETGNKIDDIKLYNGDYEIEGVAPAYAVAHESTDVAGYVLAGASASNVVADVVADMDSDSYASMLASFGGVVSAVAVGAEATKNYVDDKRVTIYTTWGNDNAKDQVAFVNASNN